jgi:hypothetical protein
MKRTLLIGFILMLGCGTVALSPEGERIRLTSDRNDVAGCAMVGVVDAKPPYIGPHDAEYTLRNKAAAIGADTLLVAGWKANTQSATAYRCAAKTL